MPVGMLDPNAGMIAQNFNGLSGAMTQDEGGDRIGGYRVLERFDPGIFQRAPGYGEALANAMGFGDLWRTGYTPGDGLFDGTQASFSPELQQRLSQYDMARVGFGDDMRQEAFIDRNTGQMVYANEPDKKSGWMRDLAEGAAFVGGTALAGGLLGGSLGGAAPAASTGFNSGVTFGAGEAGSAGLSGLSGTGGVSGLSAGGGALSAGALLPAVAPGAALATSGTLPVASIAGTSSLPAMAGGGGLLSGALGRYAPGVASLISQNPGLARTLFSLGSGLLASAGGSGGGSSGGQPPGPPRQWNSQLQTGLLTNPEQTNIATPISFEGRW